MARETKVKLVLAGVSMLVAAFWAGAEEAGKTVEGITLVKPTEDGGVVVVSKETTVPASAAVAGKKVGGVVGTKAVPDVAPRKARIVVVPAIFAQEVGKRWERELMEKLGLSDPSLVENGQYTTCLIDALVNCRKFDVLEREELKSVTKELEFGESDFANSAKAVQMGQMLNADYVVIPQIRNITFAIEDQNVPYIGKQERRIYTTLATTVRTVEVKTGKIVASDQADIITKGRVKKDNGTVYVTIQSDHMMKLGVPFRTFLDNVYRAAAMREAGNVISVAYPIKIVAVTAQNCVLNRGRGAILEGEEFEVFEPGEMLIDPDTKESLGFQEARVGRLRVVKVDEKTCTAALLEGAGGIKKLQLCRPAAPTAPVPADADEAEPKKLE